MLEPLPPAREALAWRANAPRRLPGAETDELIELAERPPSASDAQVARSPPPARSRVFGRRSALAECSALVRQVGALAVKNGLLLRRGGRMAAMQVIAPVALVLLLCALDARLNVPAETEPSPAPFLTVEPSSPLHCRVFDSESGEYGEGVPIPGAWCAPLVFAPAGNAEALSIMRAAARLRGWELAAVDVEGAGASAEGEQAVDASAVCASGSCVLGFRSSISMRAWLAHNRGRAAVAVAFVDTAAAVRAAAVVESLGAADAIESAPEDVPDGPAMPPTFGYELWYNESATAWYRQNGDDVLTSHREPPQLLPVAQAVLDAAILETRAAAAGGAAAGGAAAGGGGEGAERPRSRVRYRSYPRVVRRDFVDVVGSYGAPALAVGLLLPALHCLHSIVAEKEKGLLGAMRQIGMHEAAYWASALAQAAALVLLASVLTLGAGTACGLPFFALTDARVLLGTFWLYGTASAAGACALAAVLTRTKSAHALGGAMLVLAMLVALIAASIPMLLDLLYDPSLMPGPPGRLATWAQRLYPPLPLVRLTNAIAKRTAPVRGVDNETKLPVWAAGGSFGLAELYDANATASNFAFDLGGAGGAGGADDAAAAAAAAEEATRADVDDYSPPPLAHALGCMGASVALGAVLAWYAAQVCARGADGRAQPPLFPLLPSYWLRGARPRGNERLLGALQAEATAAAAATVAADAAADAAGGRGPSGGGPSGRGAPCAGLLPRPLRLACAPLLGGGAHDAMPELGSLDVDVRAEAVRVLTRAAPPSHRVSLVALRKWYGRTAAVCGLSVSLAEGEIFALLGHNGAGKSTTIGMLVGQVAPSAGDCVVYGCSVTRDLGAVRAMLGVCPQHDCVFSALSVEEHVRLFARLKGVSASALEAQLPRLLEAVRLSEVRGREACKLSGGMRRRLSVALAYVGAPRLIVLDEPTTGLDPYTRKFVWGMVESQRHERTTLLTTHSMEEADALGNTIGVMARGQLVALGSAVQLKRRFGSGYALRLVTRAADVPALVRRVRALLPAAALVSSSAGSCTFAIEQSAMAACAPLLQWIEQRHAASRAEAVAAAEAMAAERSRAASRAASRSASQPASPRARPADARGEEPGHAAAGGAGAPAGAAGSPARGVDGAHAAAAAAVSEGEDVRLRDWLLSHSTLEEVFLRLAQAGAADQHGRRDQPADGSGGAGGAEGAGAGGGEGGVEHGADAAAAAAAAADLEGGLAAPPVAEPPPPPAPARAAAERVPRPLRATLRKNLALLSRQRCGVGCNLSAPLLVVLGALLVQRRLVDSTQAQLAADEAQMRVHLDGACARVGRVFDDACANRTSLGAAEGCLFCAGASKDYVETCCARDNAFEDACLRGSGLGPHNPLLKPSRANQCLTTRPPSARAAAEAGGGGDGAAEAEAGAEADGAAGDVAEGGEGAGGEGAAGEGAGGEADGADEALGEDLIDFGAECDGPARAGGAPPPAYCQCRVRASSRGSERRSDALQALVDETAVCAAARSLRGGGLSVGAVQWVPSGRGPMTLERALLSQHEQSPDSESWLGWRVPVFGATEAVRSALGGVFAAPAGLEGAGAGAAAGADATGADAEAGGGSQFVTSTFVGSFDHSPFGLAMYGPAQDAEEEEEEGPGAGAERAGAQGAAARAAGAAGLAAGAAGEANPSGGEGAAAATELPADLAAVRARVRASGLLGSFPRSFGRTSYADRGGGEATSECDVAASSIACCYALVLVSGSAPDRRVQLCGAAGTGRCPHRYPPTQEGLLHFLMQEWGWDMSQLFLEASTMELRAGESYNLAEGAGADLYGDEAACVDGAPPVCHEAAADAAATRALPLPPGAPRPPPAGASCAQLAAWRGVQLSGGGARHEPSARAWRCERARCVRYDAFVVPAYGPSGWASMAALDAHQLREQSAIRAGAYASRAALSDTLDPPWRSALNLAEQLFPSWSVRVERLEPDSGTLDWVLSSFWSLRGRGRDQWFYVTEPLPASLPPGADTTWVRQTQLRRPLKLAPDRADSGARRLGLAALVPLLLSNGFTNALLAHSGAAAGRPSARDAVKVGLRALRPAKTLAVDSTSGAFLGLPPSALLRGWKRLLTLLLLLGLPPACSLLVPTLAHSLVHEKHLRLRALMRMMGLPRGAYWVSQWASDSLLSHSAAALLWAAGCAARLRYFTRSAAALLLVLQLWAQACVALAFLGSACFTRARTAALALSLLLVLSAVLALALWQRADGSGGGGGGGGGASAEHWPWWLDLYPPFAAYHCLFLASAKGWSVRMALDPSQPMLPAMCLLLAHAAWMHPLALWLDAVLPAEHGLAKHPLFCCGVGAEEGEGAHAAGAAGGGADDDDAASAQHRRPARGLLARALGCWLAVGHAVRTRSGCRRLLARCVPRARRGGGDISPLGGGGAAGDARRSTLAQLVSPGHIADSDRLTREHVPLTEDDDVSAERGALERGEYAQGAPVQVFSLRKVYAGGKVAVKNLAFKIETNECFGLLGPNGAGKSTTISVLTGLFRPSSGSARVLGHSILDGMDAIHRRMGVCPQFDILWPELTVREHMLFYCRLKGTPVRTERAAAESAAAAVGLRAKLDARVQTLSGGQKRRVSLGIALVGDPAVVFLDEPTTGLDPETRRLMWALIDNSKAGRVIVLTTHSMDEADALCGRIGIMANGELRCLGTTVHLKNKFGDFVKVDVAHRADAAAATDAFVREVLPHSELLVASASARTYSARRSDVRLSEVFERFEARPEGTGIVDWGLRQTSLEEVFLKIAREAGATADAE